MNAYPLMDYALDQSDFGGLLLKGEVGIHHKYKELPEIKASIQIEVFIPSSYPRAVPRITEISQLIPRSLDYHMYEDGVICLSSEFSMKSHLAKNSNFLDFFTVFFIPYIYAALLKKKHGIDFKYIFGDLSHGVEGEIEAYKYAFKLRDEVAENRALMLPLDFYHGGGGISWVVAIKVMLTLNALSKKKRIANKETCPCGCGKKLAKCDLRNLVNSNRKKLGRKFFFVEFEKVNAYLYEIEIKRRQNLVVQQDYKNSPLNPIMKLIRFD